jgi:SlyX protein
MQDELIELQSKWAFQEQTLSELNQVLISQQQQIDQLQLQMKLFEDRLRDMESAAPVLTGQGQHEKPPHY